jgi:predicted nucleic acid-binding protein
MKTKVTDFNSHGHHAKVVQVGNSLLRSPSLQLVHVDEAVFHAGWIYFQQHQDKACLFTDCISFVVMQKLGISTAFTSDKHFAQRASGCVMGCLVIKTHILRVLAFLL